MLYEDSKESGVLYRNHINIVSHHKSKMDTAKIAKPISGNKPYQERARAALPIIVRQAHAHSPIFYSDLATELGMPNPRNLNFVLGSIGQTVKGLSRTWREDVPPIQCLVINKNTGLPGEGIGWFITNKDDFRKLSRKQQRLLVEAELQKVFSYNKWPEVLNILSLKPVAEDYSKLLLKTREYRGGGESEQHRRLKQFVALHPELLSLSKSAKSEIEYSLPSGDSLDVLFRHGDDWIGAEIKSDISDPRDIVRGLFQCVKYRAIIESYQAVQTLPQSARAVLVLGGSLPNDLISLKNILGVEIIEKVTPK